MKRSSTVTRKVNYDSLACHFLYSLTFSRLSILVSLRLYCIMYNYTCVMYVCVPLIVRVFFLSTYVDLYSLTSELHVFRYIHVYIYMYLSVSTDDNT